MSRLFVYGSLQRGGLHHAELEGAELEGPAQTRPAYRLVQQADYPALAPGQAVVSGEVYRVSAELLGRLDAFEGCPTLYQRVEVELSDKTRAFAYAIPAERARALTPLPPDRRSGD